MAGPSDPKRDSQAVYHAGAIAHIIRNLRDQENGWRAWFAEEGIDPIDIAYPVLWRNLTAIVASVLDAIGQDPKLAPAPMLERQANQRSDEWVDRYRAEAPRLGYPPERRAPPTSATMNSRRKGKMVLPSARGG